MQLSKRTIIILSSVLAAAAIAAAVVWYRSHREAQPQENVVLNEHPTDGAFYECDIPSADPLIVGRWINTANPQWHKAYYDDYDEETEMSGSSRPVGRSLLFPDIHETVRVHPDAFGHWLETNCGISEKRGLTELKQEKIIEALEAMGR